MRKIEEQIIEAIKDRTFSGRLSIRDEIRNDSGYTNYVLHNTKVCIINWTKKSIEFTAGGWETPTTKSRINAIMGHFKLGRIYQKDFVWHWPEGYEVEYANSISYRRAYYIYKL